MGIHYYLHKQVSVMRESKAMQVNANIQVNGLQLLHIAAILYTTV
jgi:hypothetical protein